MLTTLPNKPPASSIWRRAFDRFAGWPLAFRFSLLLGLILVIPSLAAGLFADDFLHQILVNEGQLVKQPNNLSLFHLFSFIDNDPERRLQLLGFSITPWWVSPDFSLLFFRPLSELSHYIDYRWLTDKPWLMHLHSIAWYGILLATLAHFYQLFCPDRKVALLAFLFFIADATHGFTVGWLANRNAIIAAIFCLAAVIFHHRFRSSGKYALYLLSLLCIIASFLAAEAGIVTGVFLLGYALFLDQAGIRKGLASLLPALGVFLLWFALYKHYGYGAYGNNAYYVDPVASPGLFLANLPDRLLRTLAIQFNLLPLHLLQPFKTLMTVCGLLFLAALLAPLFMRHSIHYRFHLLCLLLCIIPITSAELQDRNMLFVGIAGAPLMALCVRYLGRIPTRPAQTTAILILLCHLLVSGLLMLPTSYAPRLLAQGSLSTAHSLPEMITGQHVITLGIPVFDASYLAAIRRSEGLALPAQLWNVTTQGHGLTISRNGSHRFLVKNPNGLLGDMDLILRDMQFDPLPTGSRIDMNGLVMTITATDARGIPLEAQLDIDSQIDPDTVQLFYCKQMQLSAFNLLEGETREFE